MSKGLSQNIEKLFLLSLDRYINEEPLLYESFLYTVPPCLSLWFSLGWLGWNYFGDSKSSQSNIENTSNRYMTGLVGSVVWFLYCLLIKKMNLAKSFSSAGLFLIFYIVAEIIYTILSDTN